MYKPSTRAIYAAGLKAIGAKQKFDARTSKYHVWSLPKQVTVNGKGFKIMQRNIYLGPAGACRCGRTATISADISHDSFAREIYRLGQLTLNIAPADEKITL